MQSRLIASLMAGAAVLLGQAAFDAAFAQGKSPAAITGQVSSEAEELGQVLARRQHRRGVDDDRHAAAVSDRDDLLEREDTRRAREGRDQVRDRCGPLRDRIFELEGLISTRAPPATR